MKTIAIIFALCLSACVTDEPCDEPTPIEYPPATYCGMSLDSVAASTGFAEGPCTTTVTIDMLCSQGDDEQQAFDDMVLYWYTNKPAYASGFLGLTYRCNQAQTITLPGTACEGSPFTVVAGFQHPTLGVYEQDDGTFLCADSRSVAVIP